MYLLQRSPGPRWWVGVYRPSTRTPSIGFRAHLAPAFRSDAAASLLSHASWPGPMRCLCVQVFRYDSPAPLVRCDATGDPHIKTFDGLYYDIFSTGNYIYVRNLSYVAVEVRFTHSLV